MGTKFDPLLGRLRTTDSSSSGVTPLDNYAYRLLGFNFGHDQVGTGVINTSQNSSDFALLLQHTKRLRVAMPAHDDATGVADMKVIALAALVAGFEVSVGVVVATGSNLTSYNAWKNTNVAALASWAHTNRVRNFYIGNEEDYWASQGTIAGGTITSTIVRTDVKALATSLKASYPELTLLYSTADGTIDDWNNDSDGVGSLDGIGINLYSTDAPTFDARLAQIAQRANLAPKLFVSEWASQNPYPDSMTDANYRDAVYARYRSIQRWGLEAYFFTWRLGGGTDWGIMNSDGTHKPGYEEVFGLTNYHTQGDFEQAQYRMPNGAIFSQNLSEVGALLNGSLHLLNPGSGLDVYVVNTQNDANFNVETIGVGKGAFMTLASTNDSFIGFTFYVSGSIVGRWGRNGDNSGMNVYTGAGSLTKTVSFNDDQTSTFAGNVTMPTLTMTTGATNGYVLTSDASGNASWTAGGGTGITRVITSISSVTTGAAVSSNDYVYLCSGTFTYTQPAASANKNAYTIKNISTGVITVARTGSDTIEGVTSLTLNAGEAVTLVGDSSTAWYVT